MEDLYTRTMSKEFINTIYQGLKNAYNSVDTYYIDTPKIKGKIIDGYLITERSGGYSAYSSNFEYIKESIKNNEKIHEIAIFHHIPFSMVHELIAQEEEPIPLEKQQGTESWIYMYTNEKYQIGLGTTMSLFKLRNLFNFLHEKNFIPFISETEVEKLARTNIFELKNNLANIDTLFNTLTTKKHIFNDGDNEIYLRNNGLVVQTQSYGYYITKSDTELTVYAYCDKEKKHNNIKSLLNDIENNPYSISLIDNVALKMIDNKVIFGDSLFTYFNLYEDLNIAVDELNSLRPTSKRKP